MNFEIFAGQAPEWNNWFLERQAEEFLQSYEWGEFQKSQGKQVIRLSGTENGKIVAQVQGMVHTLPLGLKYLYIPRTQTLQSEHWHALFEFLKHDGYVFVRVEPVEEIFEIGFKKVQTYHRQYQYTSFVDLTQSNEELLKNFHEKTRYNIRLAAKKGVIIKEEKNSAVFWPLLTETYTRDKIKSHPEGYYQAFIDLPGCTQLTAYYENTPLSAVLLYTFGKTCVYVHGASSNEHRNLMAPYLLQWEAMQLAKKLGCDRYDLGGVARPAEENTSDAVTFHNYTWDNTDKLSGVTRFKAGMNGTIKHYGDASDIVFDSLKYRVYQLARKFL